MFKRTKTREEEEKELEAFILANITKASIDFTNDDRVQVQSINQKF